MKNVLLFAIVLFICVTSITASDLPSVSKLRSQYKDLQIAKQDQPSKNLEIYPNPVTEGRLTISSSENIASVQILNITGKMVINQEYDGNSSIIYIELDKLEKGVYLVRVNFPGKEYLTEKIMVK